MEKFIDLKLNQQKKHSTLLIEPIAEQPPKKQRTKRGRKKNHEIINENDDKLLEMLPKKASIKEFTDVNVFKENCKISIDNTRNVYYDINTLVEEIKSQIDSLEKKGTLIKFLQSLFDKTHIRLSGLPDGFVKLAKYKREESELTPNDFDVLKTLHLKTVEFINKQLELVTRSIVDKNELLNHLNELVSSIIGNLNNLNNFDQYLQQSGLLKNQNEPSKSKEDENRQNRRGRKRSERSVEDMQAYKKFHEKKYRDAMNISLCNIYTVPEEAQVTTKKNKSLKKRGKQGKKTLA